MKAVFQNTIVSLLCLAGVVLAAPTQSMSHPKSTQNTQNPAVNPANAIQDQSVTVCLETKTQPSIEEGTVRFACW
jgi:predicted transcriptional regulator